MSGNFVYILKDEKSNKFYVGSTCKLNSRIDRHFDELNKKIHHNKNLQDLWNSGADLELEVFRKKSLQEAREEELRIINENKDNLLMLNISLSEGSRGLFARPACTPCYAPDSAAKII